MQTIKFKKNYEQYEFITEFQKLWSVFSDENIQSNIDELVINQASNSIIESMSLGANASFSFVPIRKLVSQYNTFINNKFVMCCISGGKDSAAMAKMYKDSGYDVYLYTVKGINKGYPEEYKAAQTIAEYLDLPLIIDEVSISGKKFYTEHPLKNQVIATSAYAYCCDNDLPLNIAFGNFQEDGNDRSNWGINWTDNYDLWKAFRAFIVNYLPEATLQIPFVTELEVLNILKNDFELHKRCQSCLITVRHRGRLKRNNEEKYGVHLLDNRCGSCRKCCMEYIFFCDNGYVEYNRAYYEHCLEILKKKYTEYLGVNRKFKHYKEVYDAYFTDEKNSPYFY